VSKALHEVDLAQERFYESTMMRHKIDVLLT